MSYSLEHSLLSTFWPWNRARRSQEMMHRVNDRRQQGNRLHSSVELSSWEAKRNVVRSVFEPETSARKPDTLTTELRHLHRKVMSRKCQNVYYNEASYTVSLDSRRNRDWAHISKQFYLILRACKQRLRKVRPSSTATFAVSENWEAPKETQRSVRKKKGEIGSWHLYF